MTEYWLKDNFKCSDYWWLSTDQGIKSSI